MARKRYAVTDDGTKFELVEPTEAGLVPCDGEAHSNAFIDNCGICAPRWGERMSYHPIALSALTEGKAIRTTDTTSYQLRRTLDRKPEFEAAEKAGKVRMVHLTEKRKGSVSSFYGYILVSPRGDK